MGDPDWRWNDNTVSPPPYGRGGYASQQTHFQQQPSSGNPYGSQFQDASYQNRFADSSFSSPSERPDYYSQQPPKFSVNSSHPSAFESTVFSDTKNPYGHGFSQQLLSDPMVSAARQIGGQFAESQKERLTKYLSGFHLKYYFAVDNSYVGRKLGILLFPFFHQEWTVQNSNTDDPVPARYDVNAPDLYIPLMAFVTYVLISGFVLGTQGRFSPEQLGIITTNALIYIILENVIVFVTKYVMNISQALSVWHTLAFSGYKFVGMNVCLLAFLTCGKTAYYIVLIYSSLAMVFFLIRTVRTFVLDVASMYSGDGGRKRKLYLLLFIAFTQPFIMWWLTSSVAKSMTGKMNFAHMALSGLGFQEAVKKGELPLQPDGEVDYEALLKMP